MNSNHMSNKVLNNFDCLRIVLALLVVFYHVGTLTRNDFLSALPGSIAVKFFFVISGYLITKSYFSNNDLKSYFKARFLRLYPLYIIVILTSFVVFFFVSSFGLHSYIYEGGLKYLVSNALFLNFISPDLPGVFDNNGNHGAVNGALWTIKVEVMFYCSVPIIYGLFSRFIKVEKLTIILFLLSLLFFYILSYLIENHGLHRSLNNQLPSMLSYFMVGAYMNFIGKDKKWVLYMLPFALLLIYQGFELTQPLMIGIVAYCLSFLFPIVKVSKKIGDISYGLYVWHFPVIQFYISKGFFDNMIFGLSLTIVTVLILSYFSWHLIESKLVKRRAEKNVLHNLSEPLKTT